MSVTSMLHAARASLGTAGRPNAITRAYAARHGDAFLRAPWCNMSITEWARSSGNAAAVLPEGDRAYTVWHAQDGKDLGRWHDGTTANIKKHALPGAVIFFDWSGRDGIPPIDHVGIVERNLGDGRVQTIEGNTGDACKRRVRAHDVIAGFWNPPYTKAKPKPAAPKPDTNWTEVIVKQLPLLVRGSKGWHVKTLFYLLHARGYGLTGDIDDTVFGAPLEEAVKAFQKAAGLQPDGECGPKTWAALLKAA
ncbi:peptidoglycan-binding protein [Nonomuraea sp. NPDC050663]|uniref:peptidoglycan-binding protein n=1 Tax=Nonomuraea sp. NPDC050663 TaxID=3364370 RepID=UPI0037B58E05